MNTIATRMKSYEQLFDGRVIKGLPIIARIDGHKFSTYSRKLQKPFDPNFSKAMIATAKELHKQFTPVVTFVASDEISMMWFVDATDISDLPFGGRINKLCSLPAGCASSNFAVLAHEYSLNKNIVPYFDSRVFIVPNKQEAIEYFRWREADTTKNAVSMIAQTQFSSKQLHGVGTKAKIDKLFLEKNIKFSDFDSHYKRGTFIKRVNVEVELTADIIQRIVAAGRVPPNSPIVRSVISEMNWPITTQMSDFDVQLFAKFVSTQGETNDTNN